MDISAENAVNESALDELFCEFAEIVNAILTRSSCSTAE